MFSQATNRRGRKLSLGATRRGDCARCEPTAAPWLNVPGRSKQLDRYFAAATIAHEYIADLHRELAALHQDSVHTRELLRESAR